MTRGRGALIATAVLIAYGSLFPFEFVDPSQLGRSLRAMLRNASLWSHGGDVLGNFVLFLPLGVLASLDPVRPCAWQRLVPTWLAAMAFAALLQVLQLYVPQREPAVSDVLWNGIGMAVGQWMGLLLGPSREGQGARAGRERDPVALALLVALTLGLWSPLVPTIDWQNVKDALKPLLALRVAEWRLVHAAAAAAMALVLWEAVGSGARSVVDRERLPRWRLVVPVSAWVLGVLAVKPFIAGQAIHASTIVGFGAGLALVSAPRSVRGRQGVALGAALLSLVIHQVLPWQWRPMPAPFHWLPFEAMLEGSMLANAWSLFGLVTMLGFVLWVSRELGAATLPVAMLLSAGLLVTEWLQRWMEGRTPDITAAVVALLLTLGLRKAGGRNRRDP